MRNDRYTEGIDIPVLILLVIAALLVLGILAGTLYAFAAGIWPADGADAAGSRTGNGAAASGAGIPDTAYLDLGRLRIALAPEAPEQHAAVLLVKAVLPYPAADGPFQEELARKLPDIRQTIRDSLSQKTLAEIRAAPEEELKNGLLDNIRKLLVLGSPQEIFFEEFIFFE